VILITEIFSYLLNNLNNVFRIFLALNPSIGDLAVPQTSEDLIEPKFNDNNNIVSLIFSLINKLFIYSNYES